MQYLRQCNPNTAELLSVHRPGDCSFLASGSKLAGCFIIHSVQRSPTQIEPGPQGSVDATDQSSKLDRAARKVRALSLNFEETNSAVE